MFKKIKLIKSIGAMSVLFVLVCFQVNASEKAGAEAKKTFKEMLKSVFDDAQDPDKAIDRAERRYDEILQEKDDAYDFLHSYYIISGMHKRYKGEFGSLPEAVQSDLLEADLGFEYFAYLIDQSKYFNPLHFSQEFNRNTVIDYRGIRDLAKFKYDRWKTMNNLAENLVAFELWYCADMYTKEIKDGEDIFSESNFVCNTSYKDAVENMNKIMEKYKIKIGEYKRKKSRGSL